VNAAALISAARAAGMSVKVEGERLVLSAPQRPDDRLLDELRRHKSEIVAYLHGLAVWTEEDWQALFDERAGIVEFDGGLPRKDAEATAAREATLLRSLVGLPP
jgi:hypothetical protein